MTLSTGQRRHHFKNTTPKDPAIAPLAAWPLANRNFQHSFQQWLKSGGYGPSALNTYSVAARLALGYLNKPHWMIDPEADIDIVRRYIEQHYASLSTRREYAKGLHKFAEYLYLRQGKTTRLHTVNWEYYLDGLPAWLGEHVRDFAAHKQKGWRPEERYRGMLGLLSPLCQILRWIAKTAPLNNIGDITPQIWFDYMDHRMTEGNHPNTINGHLFRLKAFLSFLDQAGEPICPRMLLVPPLKSGPRLPKDVPISQLRRLLDGIDQETGSSYTHLRQMGIMDRAWVHLMLYSGLRTCEVRRLRKSDIDWENHRIRIEQSKGLKDRFTYMNTATAETLRNWQVVREDVECLSDHIFVFRHQPMGRRYCEVRLQTYGRRCGVYITPHQLRHSCATLLLNAGAPVVSVQMVLGHERIDTTLGYARLYDGTVAADYYRAMGQIERVLTVPENNRALVPTSGELIALIDSLASGYLDDAQHDTLQALREGILSMVFEFNP